jgi:hypothetical protein
MRKIAFALLALYAFVLLGCATSAKKVEAEKPKPAPVDAAVPQPAPDESAVFGKVMLTETINGRTMYAVEQAAVLTLNPSGGNTTIQVSCSDVGEFGVYLPSGSYRLTKVASGDYNFFTDITLSVPAEQKAVYVGTIVLDSVPNGVEWGTENSTFAYSVRDEQASYEELVRKSLPEVDAKFYKSLLEPSGGIMTGHNPSRVFRAKDMERDLLARTDAVHEVVGGAIISLSYIINPVWLFTIGQ